MFSEISEWDITDLLERMFICLMLSVVNLTLWGNHMKRVQERGLAMLFVLLFAGFSVAGQAAGISGKVTQGSDNQPVGSLNVYAHRFDSQGDVKTAVTGADGTYHISGLDAGDYRVSVGGSGTQYLYAVYAASGTAFNWNDATPVTVGQDEARGDINLSLLKGTARFSGFVLDDGDRPLSDVTVGSWNETYRSWKETRTGANGWFVLDGLPAGESGLEIRIDPERRLGGIHREYFLSEGDDIDAGTLVCRKGARVTGRVEVSDSSLLKNMWLNVGGRMDMGGTEPDEISGAFSLVLPAGTYTLTVENEESDTVFKPVRFIVNQDLADVNLDAVKGEAGVIVSGTVTGTEGLAADMLVVYAFEAEKAIAETDFDVLEPIAEAHVTDGGFALRIPSVTAVHLVLTLSDDHEDKVTVLGWKEGVQSGAAGVQISASTAPRFNISGNVRMGDQPLSAEVLLIDESGHTPVAFSTTYDGGRYTFSNIPSGTYRVALELRGMDAPVWSDTITVEGGDVSVPDLTLLAAPVFNPRQGVYQDPLNISVTVDGDASETWYSVDGSIPERGTTDGAPSDTSTVSYTSRLYVPGSTISVAPEQDRPVVVRMVSFDASGRRSAMTVATYAKEPAQPTETLTGTITFAGGEGYGPILIGLFADEEMTRKLGGTMVQPVTDSEMPGNVSYTLNHNGTVGQTVWIGAVWDTNGNGEKDPSEFYYTGSIVLGENGTAKDFELTNPDIVTQGTGLTGVVRMDGQPVDFDFCIQAFEGDPCGDHKYLKGFCLNGNDQGRFDLTGLPAGRDIFLKVSDNRQDQYTQFFYAGENADASLDCSKAAAFNLTEGATEEIAFNLVKTSGTVSGRVVDDTHASVAGVRVSVYYDNLHFYRGVESDEEGNFRLSGLPEGEVELQVDPAFETGLVSQERDFYLGLNEAREMGTFALERGAAVTGTIFDSNGDPVPNAGLDIEGFNETPWGKTDSAGKFQVILKPGRYALSIDMEESERTEVFSPVFFNVEDGPVDLSVMNTIEKTDANRVSGTIEGNLVQDQDFEIELFDYTLTPENIDAVLSVDWVESHRMNGTDFELHGDTSKQGPFTLMMMTESEVNGIESGVVIDMKEFASLPQDGITLDATLGTHALTGKVTRDGAGYGWFVTLWTEAGKIAGYADIDDDGNYAIQHVKAGSYRILFKDPAYPAGKWSDLIEVHSDTIVDELVLDGSAGGETFTVSVEAGSGGAVSPSGSVSAGYGSSKTFAITPDTGYDVAAVTVNGHPAAVLNNSVTVENITENAILSVSFKRRVFTLTPMAPLNGTIVPSEPVTAEYGTGRTFTVTPEPGYNVVSFTANGSPVLPDAGGTLYCK